MADLRSRSSVVPSAMMSLGSAKGHQQQQQGGGGGSTNNPSATMMMMEGIDIDKQRMGLEEGISSPNMIGMHTVGGGPSSSNYNTNTNTTASSSVNNNYAHSAIGSSGGYVGGNNANDGGNSNASTVPETVALLDVGGADIIGQNTSVSTLINTSATKMSRFADIVGHKRLHTLQEMGMQQGVADILGTSLDNGIMSISATDRVMRHGKNVLPSPPLQSLWDFIKEAMEDKTLLILIGAAVLSLVLGMTTPDPRTGEVDRSTGWIEGAAILLSVAIVTLIGSVNNYQKQHQFAGLVESADKLRPVGVIRDGKNYEVPDSEVVVGDVVRLYGGMTFTFDALLLSGDGFACDESNLTGEADRVGKTVEADPFLLSGTSVTDGCEGTALVVAVGVSSYSGAIHTAVCEESKEQTPLQEKLEGMADTIGKFGLVAAIATFVILFIKEMYHVFVLGHTFYAMKIFENITTAVAIVVVAVPEGLPLSVTISLAYSMKRMLQDKNLVRHLAACETMGGATTICSDKTGTLTMSDMYLRALYLGGNLYDNLNKSTTRDWQIDANPTIVQTLLDCVAHNVTDVLGNNKTNQALAAVVDNLKECYGYDAASIVRATPHNARHRFPFSSIKKRSSVVVKSGNTIRHYVIGAAELVTQSCTHVYGINGQVEPLTGAMRAAYEAASNQMMASGLRTLAIAVSEKSSSWGDLPSVAPEDPLRLIGFAGIEEPLRPEVPHAIAVSHRAGIRVMMLTGDSLPTAQNIAKRCGLDVDRGISMEGSVFRAMSDNELLAKVIPTITVLARASPLDKRRMVHLLKTNPNEVVAVTGDGTNDAPALKAADVGFAMNSGSDVAKRASDIVLLDDNYVGMVKATMWGRNVRANIRKFIQFQLTVNVAACVVAVIGAVINSQNLSPLKPVQLLWLNLIMDTLAALALATELPSKCLLERGVEKKDSPIVTPVMWMNVATQGTFQLVTQLVLLLRADEYFGLKEFSDEHLSVVFNVFVMMQIFNFFNARLLSGEYGLFHDLAKSKAMLGIVALIFVSQVLIIQYAGRFFSVKPLDNKGWLVSIAIGALSLPIGGLTRQYQCSKGMREVGGGEDMVSKVASCGNSVVMVAVNAYGRLLRCFKVAKRREAAE